MIFKHQKPLSKAEQHIYEDFCEGLTVHQILNKRHLRAEEVVDFRYAILKKGYTLPPLNRVLLDW